MIQKTQDDLSQIRRPGVRHRDFWAWSAVLFSVLVCALVAWLHFQERIVHSHYVVGLENLRQSRIDLNKGFLHLSLGEVDGPFSAENGYVLLRQAVDAFAATKDDLGVLDEKDLGDFRASIAAFEEQLAEWKQGTGEAHEDPARTMALRVAFGALEREADYVDDETQRHLQLNTERSDRRFAGVLGVAALLMGALCMLIYRVGRSNARLEAVAYANAERFREAMDVTRDGLWDWNVSEGTLYQSPNCWRIFGYERGEIEETVQAFSELTHPDDRGKVEAAIQSCLQNERPTFRVEFRVKAKDGTWKWVLGRGQVTRRDAEGHALRMLGTTIDISERKRAEEEREKLQGQLIQAQKMESVGRLAGGVAHDFNNVLGVILGHAELLRDQIPASDPNAESVEEIRKAAIRAADLTRQLLAFARKQTVVPKVLNLNEAVSGMLKMLRRMIGEDIALAWLPGADAWPVKIDPSQLDQVLANLCVNARDAIADVGKVTIETRNAVLDDAYCRANAGWLPGDYVLLAISDNGCGMDRNTKEKIFEPFFTTKEMGKGTGLGLATVYGVVRQNGGFINVYSEPGKGTTFRIYLPRSLEAPEAPTTAEPSPEPLGRGETVLLVENETSLLTLIASMLVMEGYEVLTAENPVKALWLAETREGAIDLLMTDVVMPDMNGRELEAKVRPLRPDIACLYMSGYTADVIAHHGVLDPSVQFIAKPFTRRDMAAKVRAVLDSRRPA